MTVQRLIYEREEQLFHMMRISGLKTMAYWAVSLLPLCTVLMIANECCAQGNYLFDNLTFFVWSWVFIGIG